MKQKTLLTITLNKEKKTYFEQIDIYFGPTKLQVTSCPTVLIKLISIAIDHLNANNTLLNHTQKRKTNITFDPQQ